MRYLVLPVFLILPLAEIAVFILVGRWIGLGWTLALVVMTAVLGIAMLRRQGLTTLYRARATLERGEVPLAEVFDGLCLLAAGALLVIPGFVTDTLGALLFVPPVRRLLRHVLAPWLAVRGSVKTRTWRSDGRTIDGEYEEVEEPPEMLPRDDRRGDV